MTSLSVADRLSRAWAAVAEVPDPEVPALSLCDLGVVRDITLQDQSLEVVLTPTYSGCPATEFIERSVLQAVQDAGLGPVHIRQQRAPAWTTDWISEAGKQKLKAYGIAPPGPVTLTGDQPLRFVRPGDKAGLAVACPKCNSPRTEQLAAFGSTACKSLYRCLACQEPFEHFKPI